MCASSNPIKYFGVPLCCIVENETDQEIDPKSNANSTSEVFDESQSPIEDSDEATDYITPANVEQEEEFPEVTEHILPNASKRTPGVHSES